MRKQNSCPRRPPIASFRFLLNTLVLVHRSALHEPIGHAQGFVARSKDPSVNEPSWQGVSEADLQLLVDQVDERRRTVPPPSDHLRSPVGLATSPDLQGRVARHRIQAMRHEKETPDAQGAGHPDDITGHGGHLSRITTTWLPEYTSFRPVPPQLPNRRAMTAESHVRSFSPLQRRQSPSENTLSPLQRRVHSPDSFANARPRPPEHPPQVSADVSYEEMIRPQTHHADQTHAARSPASGAQMSQQRPGGRGRQAWGTPMGSPIGASPRTKFIHDRGANGTPASSIAGLLLFPPASIR